jgi:predicted phosphoribosyltransferase
MERIAHVLVATDFGPASENALETGAELAQRFGAALTLVHVVEATHPYLVGAVDALREAAGAPLDAAVARARARVPSCKGLLRVGKPWQEVVGATAEVGADLVIVGSHGRRGLPRALLGSVAERIVRHAPAPVLTVHGFAFDDREQAGRELARALASSKLDAPVVLALSRGGILVGAEVARALHAPLDVLLTTELRAEGDVVGGACEEGTHRLAPGAEAALSSDRRRALVAEARDALAEQVAELRERGWIADLWRRTVVLVTDEVMHPWGAMAAAEVVGKMDPARVVLATPLASEPAREALRDAGREIVVLRTVRPHVEPTAVYRNFREPSTRALLETLRLARASAA